MRQDEDPDGQASRPGTAQYGTAQYGTTGQGAGPGGDSAAAGLTRRAVLRGTGAGGVALGLGLVPGRAWSGKAWSGKAAPVRLSFRVAPGRPAGKHAGMHPGAHG